MKRLVLLSAVAVLFCSCGVGDLSVDPPAAITSPAAVSLYQKAAMGDMSALRQAENNFARGLNGFPRDNDRMMECWKMLGERGSVEHQRRLGLAYLHGTGVTQSDSRASEWLSRAAAQGDEKASLGLRLLNHKTSHANSRNAAKKYYADATNADFLNQATAPAKYIYR